MKEKDNQNLKNIELESQYELIYSPNQIASTGLFIGIVIAFHNNFDPGITKRFSLNGFLLTDLYKIAIIIISFYLFVTAWLPEASTRFAEFVKYSKKWRKVLDLFFRIITYLSINLLFMFANKIDPGFVVFPFSFLFLSIICVLWDVIMCGDKYLKDSAKIFLLNDIILLFANTYFFMVMIYSIKIPRDNLVVHFTIYLLLLIFDFVLLISKNKFNFLRSMYRLVLSSIGKPRKEIKIK